jgi:hypothetical protein
MQILAYTVCCLCDYYMPHCILLYWVRILLFLVCIIVCLLYLGTYYYVCVLLYCYLRFIVLFLFLLYLGTYYLCLRFIVLCCLRFIVLYLLLLYYVRTIYVCFLLYCVVLLYSCFIVYVCTRVGLLPPGANPIAVNINNNNNNNNNNNMV